VRLEISRASRNTPDDVVVGGCGYRQAYAVRGSADAACYGRAKGRVQMSRLPLNTSRTESTDFPRVQASSSCFVLPVLAEMTNETSAQM
jgi:hypothetical protein